MPFDNAEFTAWLQRFETALKQCGMPERQAMRYRGEYYEDALAYFAKGDSPDDAAVREVIGF